jgi:hypothetical protein
MRNAVLITGLLLLLVANVLMAYYAPFGLSPREGFQANMPANGAANAGANAGAEPPANSAPPMNATTTETVAEGYADLGATAGGAKDSYKPMGAYDGVMLPTGNNVSKWRYTAPNEPLLGAEFTPGPDSLFMFKNNQCKPECCGASFSCGGGCVCTTPQQRQYIAARGGNRTSPEDSA